MKKLIATLAVASLATLVGCSAAPYAPYTPDGTLTGELDWQTDRFLEDVHSTFDFGDVTDAELLARGQQMCDRLDLGVPLATMATELATGDSDADAMTTDLIRGAVSSLCPQYTDQLDTPEGLSE